jgi:uncharacterized phage-like protein YoqJ
MSDLIIAATGHRPNKLGGYDGRTLNNLVHLARNHLIFSRPAKVISGMALGWDTAWALAAMALQIPVIAALPFRGQETKWPSNSQRLYHQILTSAEKVVIVSPEYSIDAMQKRNMWMVNECNELCALWNGDNFGGTYNCLEYAKAVNKPYTNLWSKWKEQYRMPTTI